jgi:hypothetical protein
VPAEAVPGAAFTLALRGFGFALGLVLAASLGLAAVRLKSLKTFNRSGRLASVWPRQVHAKVM